MIDANATHGMEVYGSDFYSSRQSSFCQARFIMQASFYNPLVFVSVALE